MAIFVALVSILIAVVFLGWLGLQIKPKPFPAYAEKTRGLKTVKHKILWITTSAKTKNGTTVAFVMWMDDGQPWAALTLDSMVFNADISQYIHQRGP